MIRSYIRNIIGKSAEKTNIPKHWLDFIEEPYSTITVKFPLERKNGIETIIGHRVIHSNHILPTKGGLRFTKTSDLDTLGGLAAIMSFKSAILGIPYGGAKGCVMINPKEYSEIEKTLITRRFTVEMWKRSMISSATDIMGPDHGTNSRTMNVIRDTYKSLNNTNNVDIDNVVVGKSIQFGGLEAYNMSHGLGVAAAVNYITENTTHSNLVTEYTGYDLSAHKKSVIIHGFGKTGYHTAVKLLESNKYKIIGITERGGGVYNPIGLKIEEVKKYLENSEDYSLKGFDSSHLTADETLTRKCDIVVITTKEFSVDKDIASKIDCKFIFEGANIPLTKEAQDVLIDKGTIVVPDLLSSCGSQICGYIEWLKNLEHRNLTMLYKRFESRVRSQFIKLIVEEGSSIKKMTKYEGPTEHDLVTSCIEEMVFNSFENVIQEANKNTVDLRTAAYKIGLEKIYSYYDDKRIL